MHAFILNSKDELGNDNTDIEIEEIQVLERMVELQEKLVREKLLDDSIGVLKKNQSRLSVPQGEDTGTSIFSVM